LAVVSEEFPLPKGRMKAPPTRRSTALADTIVNAMRRLVRVR
jgi:hypothetical protein